MNTLKFLFIYNHVNHTVLLSLLLKKNQNRILNYFVKEKRILFKGENYDFITKHFVCTTSVYHCQCDWHKLEHQHKFFTFVTACLKRSKQLLLEQQWLHSKHMPRARLQHLRHFLNFKFLRFLLKYNSSCGDFLWNIFHNFIFLSIFLRLISNYLLFLGIFWIILDIFRQNKLWFPKKIKKLKKMLKFVLRYDFFMLE